MSKIRINDLARELEVKSKAILDALPEVGVTEKKTHSSSVEEHEAAKLRAYLRAASEAQASARQSRPSRVDSDEIKTKIDLSNISRPGDVLNAIRKQQAPVVAAVPPPVRPSVAASPAAPSVSTVKAPPPPPPSAAVPAPRVVLPQTTVRPTFSVPAPPVAQPPASAATPSTMPVPPRPASPPTAPVRGASGCSNICSGTSRRASTANGSLCSEASGSDCATASASTIAAHDCSSHRTASGISGAGSARCAKRASGSDGASDSGTSRTWSANFSASPPRRCHGSGCASSVASGRTQADASDSQFADGLASAWSWTRIASAGLNSPG
jgi:hypothetical protein